LRWQFQAHQDGGYRVIVARTIDEASSVLKLIRPRLIVVHLGHGIRWAEFNQLLWTTTVRARCVPVLVIADSYRVDQATRLYQMGVTDYISRTDHEAGFGRILDAYLRHSPVRRPRTAESTDGHRRRSESRTRSFRKAAARVG
jgi:DNA-binding response OmpR family regulator